MPRYTDPDGRVDIKSLSLDELTAALIELGSEKFRALQVWKWLWQRRVFGFDEMTNVSKEWRIKLGEHFVIYELTPVGVLTSTDGTRKFLWHTREGQQIESVLIPDEDRLTLCVSTQVGCAMACTFCLTGDLGLKRHLRPGEIINQPVQISRILAEGERITNVVMMGMGEPLHNYDNLVAALRVYLDAHALGMSHRRVTVSTVGLVPAMRKLTEELPVNLAVSLNASTEEQRRQVMPITKKYSMQELLNTCRDLPIHHHKRITFEYVMMAGFNDSIEDAARIVKLMRGIRSKVNLIPYNENPSRDIKRPGQDVAKAFQHHLVTRGIQCSIRTTRGKDISAACGQLGKADPSTVSIFGPGPVTPAAVTPSAESLAGGV
ncbi:MAG: 23S rRNA (adenine(2503)-C(2))-methyltransferase RlmN [Myxococcales bacterium]|nr:23S rRNA (adenine(2503)-C(2))-methyltransferase RlmN [Myxococcales bacterium]